MLGHSHAGSRSDRRYEEITSRDLADLKYRVTAKAGPHAAAKALQNLKTVWSKYQEEYASPHYRWPKVRSPLKDLDNDGPGRALSELEIAQIWAATFKLRRNWGAYYRFLFLIGARRTAAARIARAQVTPDWGQVFIPGARTKPAYTLPLSGAAAELLRDHFGAEWGFQPLGPYNAGAGRTPGAGRAVAEP